MAEIVVFRPTCPSGLLLARHVTCFSLVVVVRNGRQGVPACVVRIVLVQLHFRGRRNAQFHAHSGPSHRIPIGRIVQYLGILCCWYVSHVASCKEAEEPKPLGLLRQSVTSAPGTSTNSMPTANTPVASAPCWQYTMSPAAMLPPVQTTLVV